MSIKIYNRERANESYNTLLTVRSNNIIYSI